MQVAARVTHEARCAGKLAWPMRVDLPAMKPTSPIVLLAVGLAGCFAGGGRSAFDERPRECSTGFACEAAARDAKTPAEAARLYQRACDLDGVGGCFAIAYALRTGAIVVGYRDAPIGKDPYRAFAALVRACGLGAGAGCTLAADMIERGETTTEGPAAPWWEKACERGSTSRTNDTCERAARAREEAGDEERALALYQKGCTHTMGAPSCLGLGRLESKRGSPEKAAKPLGDACFFGKSPPACAEAAELELQSGKTAEAELHFRDACALGHAKACERGATVKAARDAEYAAERAERERRWEAERRAANANVPAGGGGGVQKLQIADVSTSGLRAKSVDCTLKSGNLLGSLVLVAGLGERSSALRACNTKKAFVAEWTMSGTAITAASARGSGSPASDACATRALRAMKQPFAGTCTAELQVE